MLDIMAPVFYLLSVSGEKQVAKQKTKKTTTKTSLI